jgi:arsenate reductase
MVQNPTMRTSEAARLAGIAPSAIRWYEQVGALPHPARRENGYRVYTDEDLARLRLLVSLRRLGLDPVEAGRLAAVCLDGRSIDPALVPILAAQREAIARQRVGLDALENELLDLEATVAAVDRADRGGPAPDETRAPIRVLFVCTGNSGRSQIAEALLRRMAPEFEVRSAGTLPRRVSPKAVAVLAEVGIDWHTARSKSIEWFLDEHFDYVITVCDRARETCPVFPGSENTLHWGLDDPADVQGSDDERLAAYRRTREELEVRLPPFVELARTGAERMRRRRSETTA